MSKSLGNGIDPLDVCKQYGADILRLWVSFSGLQDRHPRLQRHPQADGGKLPQDPQHGPLPAGQPARLRAGCARGAEKDLPEIDRWALMKLSALVEKVAKPTMTMTSIR